MAQTPVCVLGQELHQPMVRRQDDRVLLLLCQQGFLKASSLSEYSVLLAWDSGIVVAI